MVREQGRRYAGAIWHRDKGLYKITKRIDDAKAGTLNTEFGYIGAIKYGHHPDCGRRKKLPVSS
jgi:hypothetical protein